MKRIAVILAVVVVAGAALAWALSAPRPRYTAAQWEALGLAGDAPAGAARVLRRRLRVLPQVARPGRSFKARRRARTQDAVRIVLSAKHLHRSGRRDRRLALGRYRQCALVGRLAGRPEPLPGFPVHLVSADDAQGRRRFRRAPAHSRPSRAAASNGQTPLSQAVPIRISEFEFGTASRLILSVWRPGPDGAFVPIYTIGASGSEPALAAIEAAHLPTKTAPALAIGSGGGSGGALYIVI